MYRARPDVGAVIHGHPLYATALAACQAELSLLTHDAVLFADGLALFEDTPELVTGPQLGQAVARALGARRVVLMRNHGVLVVGKDLRWAVLAAVTLERAVRFQAIASALGPLRPISREWAERLYPEKYHDRLLDEYWAAWDAEGAPPRRRPRRLMEIVLTVNGRAVTAEIEPSDLLLDVLREGLGLTGAKRSCDVQVCGTCTVLLDGRPVSSAARSPSRPTGASS